MHWYSISNSFYWYYGIVNRACSVIVFVYIEKELKSLQVKTSTLTTARKGLSLFLFFILILYHIFFKSKYFLPIFILVGAILIARYIVGISKSNEKSKKYIIIMSNHIHILLLKNHQKDVILSRIVKYYKANTSREITYPIWQKSFYERIIKNVKKYIRNNIIN